jgi:hypothetical protein
MHIFIEGWNRRRMGHDALLTKSDGPSVMAVAQGVKRIEVGPPRWHTAPRSRIRQLRKSSLGMLRPKSSQQCCECIEWNACCFTELDRKGTKSAPCPEVGSRD